MMPSAHALYTAIEATWPAARLLPRGRYTLRDGAGGGKRVSAATSDGTLAPDEIAEAAGAMRGMGQAALFWIREGEDALDEALAAQGFGVIDPVTLYFAPTAPLAAQTPPPVSTFVMDAPLAIMSEIWAAGGIGPARLAVMARVAGPKAYVLGRSADSPAGCGFAAIHEGIAMIHALETLAALRRQGTARHMIQALAGWAASEGAPFCALAVTTANAPANALYRSLGMREAGRYHYRIANEPSAA